MTPRKAVISVMNVDALIALDTMRLSGAMTALYAFDCVACGKRLGTITHVSDCEHPGVDKVDFLKWFELRSGYARNAGGIYVWNRPPRRQPNMWAGAVQGDPNALAQCQMSSPDFPAEMLEAVLGLPLDWSGEPHGRFLDTDYTAIVRCWHCKEYNLLDPKAARAETIAHAVETKHMLRECVKHERGEPSAIRVEETHGCVA